MIANINYRGKMLESTDRFKFSPVKPCQYVHKCDNYTIVMFRTGSIRIMGCKKELDYSTLPFKMKIYGIQSMTICARLGFTVNLYKLSIRLGQGAMFEPELFPGLRYNKYNPLCVNIFSSGKVVILGIKTMNYKVIVQKILDDITLIQV